MKNPGPQMTQKTLIHEVLRLLWPWEMILRHLLR